MQSTRPTFTVTKTFNNSLTKVGSTEYAFASKVARNRLAKNNHPHLNMHSQQVAVTVDRARAVALRNMNDYQTTGANTQNHYCMVIALLGEAELQRSNKHNALRRAARDEAAAKVHIDNLRADVKTMRQLKRRVDIEFVPELRSSLERSAPAGEDPYASSIQFISSCYLFH